MTLRKVVIRVAIMNLVYWALSVGSPWLLVRCRSLLTACIEIPRKSFPDAIARDAFCFEPFVL